MQTVLNSLCHPFSADKSLAAFLAGAFPSPERKCTQLACGDGATHHLRTFVRSGQRVTLSVAQLPADQELPGADRGQVRCLQERLVLSFCGHFEAGCPQCIPHPHSAAHS